MSSILVVARLKNIKMKNGSVKRYTSRFLICTTILCIHCYPLDGDVVEHSCKFLYYVNG